jgi:dipeptidyl aminopeptidase/acylaminoacyl peptidase
MPLRGGLTGKGALDDPYLELGKGVFPAVDKVVEMGIADPKRLVVLGHSYGGYSTMGLIEQTNRFKAAIAVSGLADLVSLYGGLNGVYRYRQNGYENKIPQTTAWAETGQGRMGNPPWKDLGRYLRNSPLFYVERVQTPILLIHGDLDTQASITQSEEFFAALYRQGKRARFVQYWGEGHLFISPPNIRDYWDQVYAWLDEFCDITRDQKGSLVFDGDRVKSRSGVAPLKPADFASFDQLILKTHRHVAP